MSAVPSSPRVERLLFDGEFLKLLRVDHWEFVRRPRSKGAGFIIACTAQDELILVEQYRYPVNRHCIELPAGIIADSVALADETVEQSALRELEEETGFRGQRAEVLLAGPTACGMSAEMSYFVHVQDLQRIGPGGGVDDEAIQVHLVPLSGIDAWLRERMAAGQLVDPRIHTALYLLMRAASAAPFTEPGTAC